MNLCLADGRMRSADLKLSLMTSTFFFIKTQIKTLEFLKTSKDPVFLDKDVTFCFQFQCFFFVAQVHAGSF